jgi:MraZ protein
MVATAVFQGTSAITLDAKHRITVPVRHRELLLALSAGRLTLTKHPGGFLLVFPRPAWEAFRDKLLSMSMAADNWRRIFLGSADDVEMDAAARVLVAPELCAAAGLGRELLLIGNGHRLELWDRQRHAEHEAQTIAQGMPAEVAALVF